MSCPDWNLLARRREAEPESWSGALTHFDGCQKCRSEALEADPLLIFRRLPVADLSPAAEDFEVASVRQAVASMRTASRLESRRRFAGWRRWAAAAVLAVASLSVSWDKVPELDSVAVEARPATLEDLNLPDARVYQLGDEKFSATMIFDESLDV